MTWLRAITDWSRRKVRVVGRPRHVAQRVEMGICYLRWVAAVALALKLADTFILLRVEEHFAWVFPWSVLVPNATAIGPLLAFTLLWPREVTIVRARLFCFWPGLVMMLGCGALVGMSGLRPEYLPILNLPLLVIFAVAPMTLPQMAVILIVSLVAAASTGLIKVHATEQVLTAKDLLRMTPAVTHAVIGIAINIWVSSTFLRRYKADKLIERRTSELQRERLASRRLLERVLTEPVVEQLRSRGSFPPALSEVCVIVCDIVGFSKACEEMPSSLVVEELKRFFAAFDDACVQHGIEPLRSQGDSRLAVGGLWSQAGDERRIPAVDAVLAMIKFRRQLGIDTDGQPAQRRLLWSARIGIHTGPVMVGVMDGHRVSFDVWGETVNIAARLEQGAGANQILVSDKVLWHARNLFLHGPMTKLQVKNTLVSAAAEIIGVDPHYLSSDGAPNEQFWRAYGELSASPQPPVPEGNADRPYVLKLEQQNR